MAITQTPARSSIFYVYMLHESPVAKPYWCKVGYSNNPLKRLNELQAGNPRALRCWEHVRRPTRQFGFRFPSATYAAEFEGRVHERLEGMGLRTLRDLNYETNSAPKREWFGGLHPESLWQLMATMYFAYLDANSLSEFCREPNLPLDLPERIGTTNTGNEMQ